MSQLLYEIETRTGRYVWLDDYDYMEEVIVRGPLPWAQLDELIAARRKTSDLLRTAPAVLPIDSLLDTWRADVARRGAHPRQTKRVTTAVRSLLRGEDLRRVVTELADAYRACFPASPLVLRVPGPCQLLSAANRVASGGEPDQLDPDNIDISTVYLADFLRVFAGCGVDAILLSERGGAHLPPEDSTWCEPVRNVADHYGWSVGEALETNATAVPEGAPDRDFVIASEPVPGVVTGVQVGDAFWREGQVPPAPPSGFYHVTVPTGILPELLLDRLRDLRC